VEWGLNVPTMPLLQECKVVDNGPASIPAQKLVDIPLLFEICAVKIIKCNIEFNEETLTTPCIDGLLTIAKKFPHLSEKYNIIDELYSNVKKGDLLQVRYSLSKMESVQHYQLIQGVVDASSRGHLKIVKYLVEDVPYNIYNASTNLYEERTIYQEGPLYYGTPLAEATMYNHLDVVKYLVKITSPIDFKRLIKEASICNSIDVLKYIVPFSGLYSETEYISEAFYQAFTSKRPEVIKYFLSISPSQTLADDEIILRIMFSHPFNGIRSKFIQYIQSF
jgi:hypothetical protein